MVRKISEKKYKQHFYGNKKKKISIRFFYNFLIFIIVCLGLFLVTSIYFSAVAYIQRSQIIQEKKDMQFIFTDNQGGEHNITQEATEHGASNKWDYLFRDYSTGNIINTGSLISSGTSNTGTIITAKVETNNLSGSQDTNNIVKPDIKNNIVEKNFDVPKKNCITPRGKILEDGKSVLAYQQRSDSPDICNIQRRICNDGVLGGSFEQKACKTDLPYTYTKTPIVSYNTPKIDPLIQPNKDLPINKGANFDTQGKINGYTEANTLRDNSIDNSLQADTKTVIQIENIEPNCISPWGGIVLNGQFVRAYRYKNGFINHPCEVELRPCMQGNLEGAYRNASCKHWDISFEDFMDGYFNKEQPSMLRIIETLNKDIPEDEVIITKSSIWTMILNLW